MKCFNKKMSRLQCTFNWINFSFITQSLKTKHIRMTRQALPPDTEQEPNYFNIILNYSISPRLADDHDTVWEHHSKQSSVKSSQSSFSGDVQTLGEGQQIFFFPFLLEISDWKSCRQDRAPGAHCSVLAHQRLTGWCYFVIFLNPLSEKQMTDTLFELCNQEQAGVTNCSVYCTGF